MTLSEELAKVLWASNEMIIAMASTDPVDPEVRERLKENDRILDDARHAGLLP